MLLILMATSTLADNPKPHQLAPVPIQQVVIQDEFWSPKLKTWRKVTLPDCLAKFEKDGALINFDKIRDGAGGEHGGPPWYDGLIYEMIRGGADFLASQRDAVLEARLDSYIERIAAAAAKDPDGYLNTYTQLKEPGHRWGLNGGDDNHQHDVYNAGAMVEAAVHYFRATGKTGLLQVATRLANHMADVMGPPPKQNVVPGHSLGEEAMVKLYLLFREKPELKAQMPVSVDEPRYLKLAEFWIENRGNHEGRKSYGPYGQDHQPVLQQETIEGHAVRATLLGAGLVATANVNGREDYLTAARRLWENMVQRRMYVIGGLGAVAGHEGFGPDYVLPNNGYLETCAAIGAGFFHHNLNLALADARYADELERALYNAILPGVSFQGNTYSYENPLEAGPKRVRWAWHGCPCCPPMFLKIMGALPGYIYAQEPGAVYVNLFVGSRANLSINGVKGLEAADNGGQVRNLVISPEAQLSAQHRADLLGGVTVITGQALAWHRAAWPESLYLPSTSVPGVTPIEFTAIPYFANANRQPGEMRVWIAETTPQADPLPLPTLASCAIPSASHCWQNDTLSALNDQIEPAASDDLKIPRFTWWNHRGTQEWVQYDFEHPTKVSAVEVYWWDERRINAHCRVPQSWRLLYQSGDAWKPVIGAAACGVEMDRFNRFPFDPVATKALRLEVELQPEWSGGILEWRVE